MFLPTSYAVLLRLPIIAATNASGSAEESSRLKSLRPSHIPPGEYVFSNPNHVWDDINAQSYYSSRKDRKIIKTHRRSNAADTIVLEPNAANPRKTNMITLRQMYGIKLSNGDKAGYFAYLKNYLKNSGYRPSIVDLDRTVKNPRYDDFTKFLIEGLGIRPDFDTLQKAKLERPRDKIFLNYLDKYLELY